MEIEPYETEIFYDKFGLRLWEKRHSHILSLLPNESGLTKAKETNFIILIILRSCLI
jgi:hypothetical protein